MEYTITDAATQSSFAGIVTAGGSNHYRPDGTNQTGYVWGERSTIIVGEVPSEKKSQWKSRHSERQ
jgi:hypothetical protein